MSRPFFAFFDVDHTLMRGSTGSAFAREVHRAGLVGVRDVSWAVAWNLLYAFGLIDEITIWHKSVGRLIGKPEAPFREACAVAHERRVRGRLYAEGRAEIARHRADGGQIALISAGPRYGVLEVARDLAVEHTTTAWARIVDGVVHDVVGAEIPYGVGKRSAAERYCRDHGVDPADCWAYGDSRGDIEMLELVGHPVAVNPRKALRKVAEARGWSIVKWHKTAETQPAT